MNKAKILAFLTAVFTIASCTACGDTEEKNSNSSTDNSNISSSVADSNSDIPEISEDEEETSIKWQLKDVAVPDFEMEIIEVEGNCVEPVKKVKSFLNADNEQIKEYIYSSSFYQNFLLSESSNELVEAKSHEYDSAYDENIKDDAVGYNITNRYSGLANDASIEFEIERDTGKAEGLTNVHVRFDANKDNFNENIQNAYDLVCQTMPAEYADYLFYGGTELELDEIITDSNGVNIRVNRDVEIDKYDDEVSAALWIKIIPDSDTFKTMYDDADYVPREMEYSFEELLPFKINTDIHNSKNAASELFNPFPIYGAEYVNSNLRGFSSSRRENSNGEIEISYSFEASSMYNEDGEIHSMKDYKSVPYTLISAYASTRDGELKTYGYNLIIEYDTLYKNNKDDETDNYCAKVTIEALQKLFPDTKLEVRSFEQLNEEDYKYTFETTFNGVTVPVEVEISSSYMTGEVTARVNARYHK